MNRFNIKRLSALLIVLMISLLASACNSTSEQQATEEPAAAESKQAQIELTISAAASLQQALAEIQPSFENEHPHIKLQFNYGGSGSLQRQIEQGAPVDLFISASESHMKALVDKGLIKSSEQPLLRNELVVVVPKDNDSSLKQLQDLNMGSMSKIAIGVPETVPAGAYAKESLEAAKLWDALQSKFVQAKDVRQVLQYVETGSAQAGFVYKTDVLSAKDAKIAFIIEEQAHSPIVYPIGMIQASKHHQETEQLYQYLQTPQVMSIFAKYGFTVPEAS
ncbi:molybdate ABC transporter substrate-binding protein [Paenibacillus sp. 1001270B_150601_E10]|uniref:molybdate ABC transporter substrate-binding protein n=1 Tax=Paenibacillus sp. 1001270B_150601_E10 TaxID=2787079 RepID=UPI00189EC5FF|nr:molybdate ABC transporter substrate-binding protein [Paenibacillus sp. 1001270B_150601_E10]